MKQILLLYILCLTTCAIQAQIKLPKIIGSNMVIQQGKPISIWGSALPDTPISVQFNGQTQKTVTNKQGNWNVQLLPMKASKLPQTMIIKSRKEKLELKNILIGEVWLASGQSNMEYTMKLHHHYKKPRHGKDIQQEEFEKARLPLMRILHVEKSSDADSLPTKGWQNINHESLATLSATAYFFGKTLIDSLGIPVGIISSSVGGTQIETWTPEDAYMASPLFKTKIKDHKLNDVQIARHFNPMIREIIPFTLKGFIWYQGETNLMAGNIDSYPDLQRTLVESWRSLWKDTSLPFYYVQIAPHTYSQRRRFHINNWESLPRFWEKQTGCMQIPHTGMAVTTDLVDDVTDIHPSYKWEVGRRLALWALSHDYGYKQLVYSGPQYRTMHIEGNKIILEFDHVGSGLTTNNGKAPEWFQIAGENNRFYQAEAIIKANKIILSSNKVQHPINARFAWDEIARPNLINQEGLPAVPFRTDNL